jgi:hypothetical protein
MAIETPTPRDLAARLMAHARRDGRGSASGGADAAVAAFDGLAAQLCRWLGAGGSHALLTRALTQARTEHPVLAELGVVSGSQPRLDRVAESVKAHGEKKVGAGLEATLVALLELVGRLIGDDLSLKLAELSMAIGVPDPMNPEDERAP